MSKQGYATVDIFMKEEVWQEDDGTQISKYLDQYTRIGFAMMLERVVKKKINIDALELSKDFEAAMEEFGKHGWA